MMASVLQDIMPVLARIQTRSPHAPVPGLPGLMSSEAVAAVALVSDLGADSLRRLTAYLDAETGRREGLEACVPLASAAAQALASRDYALAFTMIFDCYRTIAMLRVADPSLPLPGSIRNLPPEGRRADGPRGPDADEREMSSGPPH